MKWPGASVVIIASGPSLTLEDCELVRQWREAVGGKVVAINKSYERAPWADVLYGCDEIPFWRDNIDGVRATFRGELWTQDAEAAKKYRLHYIRSVRAEGLSRTPGVIHQGFNGTFQAMNLVDQWGAARQILLGVDMSDDGKRTHWHKPHAGAAQANLIDYWACLQEFKRLAADLKAKGVSVVNATRRTALQSFPLVRLEDALAVPVRMAAD